MKALKRTGASPGGPALSVAKKRRLAALDDAFSVAAPKSRSTSTSAAQQQGGLQPAPAYHARPGAAAEPSGRAGEFPYNRLGDAVLDGSLSAALAQAKAAAAAAAEAAGSAGGGGGARSAPIARNPAAAARSALAPPTAAAAAHLSASTAAAAAAAAAGGDSVAAEILAQLVVTNPRASSSELRNLLAQRLQDRWVMLDNPPAPVKVNKLFARRGTKYSAKLRSMSKAKASDLRPVQTAKRTPSYEAMLHVHNLWLQYTQNLARSGTTAGGAAAPSNNVELHGAMLSVVKHPNPQLVGTTGVVLRRSSKSVQVVTPGDRVRVVQLKGCVAHYTVNGATVQLAR